MLLSEVGRGKLWAGHTNLALTIAVEQTGPMQLTIRAGSYTSTGSADKQSLPGLAEKQRLASVIAAESARQRDLFLDTVHDQVIVASQIRDTRQAINNATNALEALENISETLKPQIDAGEIELVEEHSEIRIWHKDENGVLLASKIYTLAADQVFDLISDATYPRAYSLFLVETAKGEIDVLSKSFLCDGYEVDPPMPDGLTVLYQLVYLFTVPAACTALNDVPIYYSTVETGVYPGDQIVNGQLMQKGVAA